MVQSRTARVVHLTPMHDAHWTTMKTMGWEGQLNTLEQVLSEAP
jgi:hypothetical protein